MQTYKTTRSQSSIGNNEPVLKVSELNQKARRLLELNFNSVRVEGELSSLARPHSGHWYFTLKDQNAQLRCAMFRNRSQLLRFTPKEGDLLIARGRLSLYEARGDYQLIVESLQPAGEGALRLAFEQLKQRLANEGLFAQEHKQALPELPNHIGIVTSATGAALRDILSVLRRRFPAIPVTLLPAAVQGEQAAEQIVAAIERANQHSDCDLLIVGRGGGSLEDLWCFNEEIVARAIFSSRIPVISAVGHEIDFTIADLVADQRAATPSAAAELATPDAQQYLQRTQDYQYYFIEQIKRRLAQQQTELHWLHKRLRHPGDKLREQMQRLDDLDTRMQRAWRAQQQKTSAQLQNLVLRLGHNDPSTEIQQLAEQLFYLITRLRQATEKNLNNWQQRLHTQAIKIQAVSPLATLARGYSIITRDKDQQLIKDSRQVKAGEELKAQLAQGELICQVTRVIKTNG